MKTHVELTLSNLTMRGYHHQSGSEQVVVMFHGFTGHKTESGYLFSKLSSRFEKEHIDSIRFDYFGSGESDGLFSDMTLDVLIEQANLIIEYAKSFHYKELYLLGFSMGGALALNLLPYADKTILISPAIEFYKRNLSSLVQLENGNYDISGFECNHDLFPSFKKDYDNFAKAYKNPVCIIQGTNDAAVMYNAVEKFSRQFDDCDLLLIENGAHTFNHREHYLRLEQRILEFIKKY